MLLANQYQKQCYQCWIDLVPCKLLDRVRLPDSSTSFLVCARGVALSDQSLTGVTEVVKGGGDIGLLPTFWACHV